MAETLNPADWGAVPVDDPASWGAVRVDAPSNPALDVTKDVAKSAGIGVAKGAIGLAGMGGDVADLIHSSATALAKHVYPDMNPDQIADYLKNAIRLMPQMAVLNSMPRSKDIQSGIEGYTGEFYKPQTGIGKAAETIGEFVPAAVAGPASGARAVAGNIGKFAVAPGLAAEGAGKLTEGSAVEPYARAGAAIATGGAAAALLRPKTAADAIRGAIPETIDNATMDAAETLFQNARAAGQPITRAEAVQYVSSGATKLGDLQRVVEGQGELKQFFAERPAQNEAAARTAFDQISPASQNPSTIGRQAGRAAQGEIQQARDDINTATKPLYDASKNVRLTPEEMTKVRAVPGYDAAAQAIRSDPQLARYVEGLPEDSYGFLHEVDKLLNQQATAARPSSLNPQGNMQRSAGFAKDAEVVGNVLKTGSSDFANAQYIQAKARENYLQPLLDGPLGQLAKRDVTTQKAINALFPANPLPNSEAEITRTMDALARRSPNVARQLVRAHAESTFNEAGQNLIAGPNQFGGAKFAAAIRGNPQQAANLEASVRALPNGDQVWQGFDRFLQIVEAQGTRQRIGSQTAFNQETLSDLRRGTPIQEIGSTVATVGLKLSTKVKDTLERWRLGEGTSEIAALLSSPEAAHRFRQIASMPSGGRAADILITRLVTIAQEAAQSSKDRTQ